MKSSKQIIGGVELELHGEGEGRPLLLLHGPLGAQPDRGWAGALARGRRLIVPSHPGFGHSALPEWLSSVDDIAHLYLGLLDALGLDAVDVIGCSIGGWIAAEMGVKAPERFRRIVLAGPVGIKVGPSDRLDVPDIFAMSQAQLDSLLYHDPENARLDVAAMSDDALRVMLRNREAMVLLCWEPWMHNPKLRHHLYRLRNPVLLLRGESDGLVSAAYLAAWAGLLPDARVGSVPEAGHLCLEERPEAFAAQALAFLAA